jgi:hypothetical protein
MLNPLNNDIVLHQGTIIGTAVLYTDTIYPVLSEEDETEIENLNTLRRLQFDKNIYLIRRLFYVSPLLVSPLLL